MIYKHHKGGYYRVVFESVSNSTNDGKKENFVVYVSLSHGTVHAREYGEFHAILGYENNVALKRFQSVGPFVPMEDR